MSQLQVVLGRSDWTKARPWGSGPLRELPRPVPPSRPQLRHARAWSRPLLGSRSPVICHRMRGDCGAMERLIKGGVDVNAMDLSRAQQITKSAQNCSSCIAHPAAGCVPRPRLPAAPHAQPAPAGQPARQGLDLPPRLQRGGLILFRLGLIVFRLRFRFRLRLRLELRRHWLLGLQRCSRCAQERAGPRPATRRGRIALPCHSVQASGAAGHRLHECRRVAPLQLRRGGLAVVAVLRPAARGQRSRRGRLHRRKLPAGRPGSAWRAVMPLRAGALAGGGASADSEIPRLLGSRDVLPHRFGRPSASQRRRATRALPRRAPAGAVAALRCGDHCGAVGRRLLHGPRVEQRTRPTLCRAADAAISRAHRRRHCADVGDLTAS
eukprot:COSAG04_NODE_197_length_20589_cov_16.786920_8_plen_380_part_00